MTVPSFPVQFPLLSWLWDVEGIFGSWWESTLEAQFFTWRGTFIFFPLCLTNKSYYKNPKYSFVKIPNVDIVLSGLRSIGACLVSLDPTQWYFPSEMEQPEGLLITDFPKLMQLLSDGEPTLNLTPSLVLFASDHSASESKWVRGEICDLTVILVRKSCTKLEGNGPGENFTSLRCDPDRKPVRLQVRIPFSV